MYLLRMPIEIRPAQPSICIRRRAFEKAGLTRATLDHQFGLTSDEFQVEGDLIVIGPLFGDSASRLLADLDHTGLEYYDDYFELSGNWPTWLTLYAMNRP